MQFMAHVATTIISQSLIFAAGRELNNHTLTFTFGYLWGEGVGGGELGETRVPPPPNIFKIIKSYLKEKVSCAPTPLANIKSPMCPPISKLLCSTCYQAYINIWAKMKTIWFLK